MDGVKRYPIDWLSDVIDRLQFALDARLPTPIAFAIYALCVVLLLPLASVLLLISIPWEAVDEFRS